MARRLAVIGAGPVGLCAALEGVERGFDVTVLEKDEVGAALLDWGSTRLFSPFAMNVSELARKELGARAPGGEALLTGPEMVSDVLRPLSEGARLRGRVRTRHRVAAVGRAGLTRMEFAGHPLRAERPFRLLVESPSGQSPLEADAVLDASGVTGQPCHAGPGGLPARGESAPEIGVLRSLGALERALEGLGGREALLIGHGHSAATAVLRIAELAARAPRTRLTWAVRSGNRRPVAEVAGDPLPERARIAARANDLAASPPVWLVVERRAHLEAVERRPEGRLHAVLSAGREGDFARVIALTGYRPDWGFLSELALEVSPATEGARGLSRALANVTDCLSVPPVLPEDLRSGEPGFFLIGAKSFGRSRNFLLQSGLAQMAAIFEMI